MMGFLPVCRGCLIKLSCFRAENRSKKVKYVVFKGSFQSHNRCRSIPNIDQQIDKVAVKKFKKKIIMFDVA